MGAIEKKYDVVICCESKDAKNYSEYLRIELLKNKYIPFIADMSIDKKYINISEIDVAIENCEYFIQIFTSNSQSDEFKRTYKNAISQNKKIILCMKLERCFIVSKKDTMKLKKIVFSNEEELASRVVFTIEEIKEQSFESFMDGGMQETIGFNCEGCNKRFKLKEKFAGKKVKCKYCGKTMIVPSLELDNEILDEIKNELLDDECKEHIWIREEDSHLQRHYVSYKCEVCGKTKLEDKYSNNVCPLCGNGFGNESFIWCVYCKTRWHEYHECRNCPNCNIKIQKKYK